MKKELYLDWEIIRKQRMVLGITQEKLCEDICSQETLARIEHGRRPHNKNYRKITEDSLEKEKRSNTINIWDYEVLKLKSEVSAFIETYRYCEAKERLLSFPFQETVESQQYFMYTKAVLEMQLKEIKEEEAIKIFEEALFMTLSIKNFEKLSQCVLTSQEVIILNGIAIAYAQMGQRKVAVKLYEKILEGYENSKIIPQFKSKEISIILRNMAGYLEGLDKFDEALQTFEKAMNFVFQCGTMCEVSELLANAAYTLERKGKRKEGSGMLIQAYFISDLVNCEKIRKIVRMHYEEVYKKI